MGQWDSWGNGGRFYLRKAWYNYRKTNALNSFIPYMKLTHVLSVGKDIDGKESERDKDNRCRGRGSDLGGEILIMLLG